MILNGRSLYRGLKVRGRPELDMLKGALERGGYCFEKEYTSGRLLERKGLDVQPFGLVAVKEDVDGIVHEYVAVGQRDGFFGMTTDVIRGRYRQDEFLPTISRDVENNPGYIPIFVARNAWPLVLAASFLGGVVGAIHFKSDISGIGCAVGAIAAVTVLTQTVRKGFEFYLRSWEGVEYGSRALRDVLEDCEKPLVNGSNK